jgi:hypothetical protein
MKILFDFDVFPSPLFNNLTGSRNSTLRADMLRLEVQRAADLWSAYLNNDFPEILEGSEVEVIDPSDPLRVNSSFPLPNGKNYVQFELAREVDDIVIYAAGSDDIGPLSLFGLPPFPNTGTNNAITFLGKVIHKDGITDRDYIIARDQGINYMPSVASISFNSTLNWSSANIGIQNNQQDIFLTALHEIGHVLGFNNRLPALQRFINTQKQFVGTQISLSFDNDLGHILANSIFTTHIQQVI